MPRSARKKSSTAIYHIILKGINKQLIFEGDEESRYFLQGKNNDRCLECDDGGRLNDPEATELIKSIATVKNPGDIQAYEKQKRSNLIKLLKEKGLSIRQIERLTGVSFGVIRGI